MCGKKKQNKTNKIWTDRWFEYKTFFQNLPLLFLPLGKIFKETNKKRYRQKKKLQVTLLYPFCIQAYSLKTSRNIYNRNRKERNYGYGILPPCSSNMTRVFIPTSWLYKINRDNQHYEKQIIKFYGPCAARWLSKNELISENIKSITSVASSELAKNKKKKKLKENKKFNQKIINIENKMTKVKYFKIIQRNQFVTV